MKNDFVLKSDVIKVLKEDFSDSEIELIFSGINVYDGDMIHYSDFITNLGYRGYQVNKYVRNVENFREYINTNSDIVSQRDVNIMLKKYGFGMSEIVNILAGTCIYKYNGENGTSLNELISSLNRLGYKVDNPEAFKKAIKGSNEIMSNPNKKTNNTDYKVLKREEYSKDGVHETIKPILDSLNNYKKRRSLLVNARALTNAMSIGYNSFINAYKNMNNEDIEESSDLRR